MGAARMRAPEMKRVALVVELAGNEMVGPARAFAVSRIRRLIQPAHAEHGVGAAGMLLSPTRIPPAEPFIGARRTFAGKQGVTGPVCDVGEPDTRTEEQHAVRRLVIESEHALIGIEAIHRFGDFRRSARSRVGGTHEQRDRPRLFHMRRVVAEVRIGSERRLDPSPKRCFAQLRQEPGVPAQVSKSILVGFGAPRAGGK